MLNVQIFSLVIVYYIYINIVQYTRLPIRFDGVCIIYTTNNFTGRLLGIF